MNIKQENKIKSVLIVSAHADDHIACAGTLLKLRAQGFELYEIVLTDSCEGQDYRKKQSRRDLMKIREDELSEASRFLGMAKTYRLNQKDFDLQYSQKIVFRLVRIVRQLKPLVGIIHNQFDWHPDHVTAAEIGRTAFKLAATGVRPKLGANFRTPLVLAAEGMLPIQPDVLVDVTKYADQKRQLWSIYQSQARPVAVSFDEGLMRVRGYHLRRPESLMAEAFSIDSASPIILFDQDDKSKD